MHRISIDEQAVVKSLTVGDGLLFSACDGERVCVVSTTVLDTGNCRGGIRIAAGALLEEAFFRTCRVFLSSTAASIATSIATLFQHSIILWSRNTAVQAVRPQAGRTRSNLAHDCRGVVRTWVEWACVLETTSHVVVAVGGSPGRRLVPHGMLVVDIRLIVQALLLKAGTGRYVAAGRGNAAARRKEQTDYGGGRRVEYHDNNDAVLRSARFR